MLSILIHILEASIVGLVALGAFRVKKLVEAEQTFAPQSSSSNDEPITVKAEFNEKSDSAPVNAEDQYQLKMSSIKQAQAFAGNQLFEINREYHQARETMPEWLLQAISLYLIGAVDFISKQENCENKARKDIITTILKSNLKIENEKAQEYFVEAVCREPNSDNDNIVIAGANAAKAWLQQQIIPESHKLSTQVQSWGILA